MTRGSTAGPGWLYAWHSRLRIAGTLLAAGTVLALLPAVLSAWFVNMGNVRLLSAIDVGGPFAQGTLPSRPLSCTRSDLAEPRVGPLLRFLYLRAIALDQRNVRAHLGLGLAYGLERRCADVATSLDTAFSLAPEDEIIGFRLAETYLSLGERDLATYIYRQLNNAAHVLVAEARMAEHAGSISSAIDKYQMSLAVEPNQVGTMYSLGELLAEEEKWELAADVFRSIIDLDPAFSRAYQRLGEVYYVGQGDFASAEDMLVKGIAYGQPDADLYVVLGYFYRLESDFASAIRCLEKAAVLFPDDAEVLLALGASWLAYGDSLRAEALLERAVEISPEDGRIHHYLGRAYAQQGLYAEAVGEYMTALNLEPDNEWLHVDLGRAYAATGQTERAVAHYQRALEIDPDNAAAQEGMERAGGLH